MIERWRQFARDHYVQAMRATNADAKRQELITAKRYLRLAKQLHNMVVTKQITFSHVARTVPYRQAALNEGTPHKFCPGCGQDKPLTRFGRLKKSESGWHDLCRWCRERKPRTRCISV